MTRIGVMGPQGSGKTTQGKLLSQALNLPLIDCGDLVREKAKEQTQIGEELRKVLANGGLVDNQVAGELVKEKLTSPEFEDGFVMDGYPRSLDQINVFDPEYDYVIYLDIPEQIVIERLLKRGRADDTPELISKRLQLYHQLTEKVLDHYLAKGKLIRVDGVKTESEIASDILQKLGRVI